MKKKFVKRFLSHKRVRAKISGTKECPRLSVFRSNKYVFLQLIDDDAGKTIIGISDKSIKSKKGAKKSDFAYEAGKLIAEQAAGKGIKKAGQGRLSRHCHSLSQTAS